MAFGDGTEGSLRVIVSPLRRLTPKAGAAIDAVGTVDGVIESLGPFITGTYLDPDDVVSAKAETLDGQARRASGAGRCAATHHASQGIINAV